MLYFKSTSVVVIAILSHHVAAAWLTCRAATCPGGKTFDYCSDGDGVLYTNGWGNVTVTLPEGCTA